MKKLSITLITLVIFSSIEGFAQKQPTSAHGNDNHRPLEFSNYYLNESVNSFNSVQISTIAKLPLDKIHSQNKRVRHHVNVRWEDSLLEKDSLYQIQNPYKSMIIYIPGRRLYK